MKYLSVCSGIEAATVAWHSLGWKPVGFSEIEPFPSAVLAHHYHHVPNFGDMTKFQEWPLDAGAIDLLVGGTPCQSFSVAGLRQGLKDPRGNLMLTYLAIAARLRPRWIVWENVPGVLSSSGGNDFASFLTGLGQLGYGWAYRVLDAQWVRSNRHSHAVPQRRRRVFVVGCLGDATAAAKVLFERESVQRHSKKSEAAREEIAADAEGSVGTGCWWDGGNTSDTLTKCEANGAQRMPDKDNFGAVLQPLIEQVAQAIPLDLRNSQRDPEKHDAQNRQGLGVGNVGDPAPTVDASFVHGVAHAFYSTGGSHGLNQQPEVCPAIKVGSSIGIPSPPAVVQAMTVHSHAVGTDIHGCVITGDVAATMGTKGSAVNGHGPTLMQAMTVRRLTPRECERLQGFPDEYTLIPWRKKAAGDCPDGPRYKALGNSMAVNCMEWIGERIAAVEAEKETT